jgi:hypothetical protein
MITPLVRYTRATIPLGRLAHLTATEAEDLEEAAAPPGEVLHDPAVHVHLELEEVHLLPVGAVQCQHVPRLGYLQTDGEYNMSSHLRGICHYPPVLGIRDVLVRIRIPGSVPLTNGSGGWQVLRIGGIAYPVAGQIRQLSSSRNVFYGLNKEKQGTVPGHSGTRRRYQARRRCAAAAPAIPHTHPSH